MKRMTPEKAKRYLGVHNGTLSPCPDLPNCVCSQFPDDPSHFMAPLQYSTDLNTARQIIRDAVAAFANAEIAEETAEYLRFEFTSRLFKFVDDVEFLFRDETKTVHFRSASRLGHWDMNQNKKRLHKLITKLKKQGLAQQI